MANARSSRVLVVDTTAQISETLNIEAIKYIGAASGAASIKADSSSGTTVWEESGSSNVFNEVCMRLADGAYITIASGAKLYIYLK